MTSWDAKAGLWSGVLTVPGGTKPATFQGKADGLFRLLEELHNQWRKFNHEQQRHAAMNANRATDKTG